MKVRLTETLATGAPFVVPVVLSRLDALRELPDDAHALRAAGVSVRVAMRAGETVGWPPNGARIGLRALNGTAAFPVFDGTLVVEPVDALSCRLVLTGSYTVPLGTLGAIADRTILAGAAKSSLRELLSDVREDVATSVTRSVAGA